MKKFLYIRSIFFLFFLQQISYAQNKNIDSLKAVLVNLKNDTNKVKTLNAIAWELKGINPDTAIIICNQSLPLAHKIKWTKGEAQAEHQLGLFFNLKGNYELSLSHYNNALKLWEDLIKSHGKESPRTGIAGKAKSLGNIGNIYREQSDYPKALNYYFISLKMKERIGDKNGMASTLGNIGNVYLALSAYPKALFYYEKALKIANELNLKPLQATNLGNIGAIYIGEGDYAKALDYYFKSLKLNEELADNKMIANTLGNIGAIYLKENNYTEALDYFFKELNISQELGLSQSEANALGNIGIVYYNQSNYSEALKYYTKSLKVAEELGLKQLQSANFCNIGEIYQAQLNYTKALEYYLKALNIDEELGLKLSLTLNLGNIGQLYTKTGNFREAEKYLTSALAISTEINALENIKDQEEFLSELYEITGKPKLALIHYKKHIAARDAIFNEENQKKQVRLEMNYEFEKKELAAKAGQDKKDTLAAQAKQKQKLIFYFLLGVVFLITVFIIFLYRRFKITQKQKITIEHQKHLIEETKQEMIDSITYAKRIQDAILPPLELISEKLPNSFVLYKPKDIVAGDFYWFEKIGDIIFIAAADCTGHGVPGAMVSVVCSGALNRAVKEFGLTETGKILDKVRELVIETFIKSNLNVKDGMDISLLSVEYKSANQKSEIVKVNWSGANNPLWYFEPTTLPSEEGNFKLVQITADKQPIGNSDHHKPFTTHTISLSRGDGQGGATTFYLFTDGYADQFGGPKGKKFKYKQFQEKIFASLNKELEMQHSELDTVFENWKGDLEQVDDVCVIGIRL